MATRGPLSIPSTPRSTPTPAARSPRPRPLGAVAKFAASGKATFKKDLAMMAMAYENVYVAQVAFGAKDVQTVRAFMEAESYDGPSVIIAYSPCIAHGVDLSNNLRQQDMAVNSGHWALFRYDPRRAAQGENPLLIDSKPPSMPYRDFIATETRFSLLNAHASRGRRALSATGAEACADPLQSLRAARASGGAEGADAERRLSLSADENTQATAAGHTHCNANPTKRFTAEPDEPDDQLSRPGTQKPVRSLGLAALARASPSRGELEDSGAAAIVMWSLFEEAITAESESMVRFLHHQETGFAEIGNGFLPQQPDFANCARSVSGAHPQAQGRARHPGHRQSQRRHRQRLDPSCRANWSRPAPMPWSSMSTMSRATSPRPAPRSRNAI